MFFSLFPSFVHHSPLKVIIVGLLAQIFGFGIKHKSALFKIRIDIRNPKPSVKLPGLQPSQ